MLVRCTLCGKIYPEKGGNPGSDRWFHSSRVCPECCGGLERRPEKVSLILLLAGEGPFEKVNLLINLNDSAALN